MANIYCIMAHGVDAGSMVSPENMVGTSNGDTRLLDAALKVNLKLFHCTHAIVFVYLCQPLNLLFFVYLVAGRYDSAMPFGSFPVDGRTEKRLLCLFLLFGENTSAGVC